MANHEQEKPRRAEVAHHPAAVPGAGAAVTHAHILYPDEYQRGEVNIYRAPGYEEGMPVMESEEAVEAEGREQD